MNNKFFLIAVFFIFLYGCSREDHKQERGDSTPQEGYQTPRLVLEVLGKSINANNEKAFLSCFFLSQGDEPTLKAFYDYYLAAKKLKNALVKRFGIGFWEAKKKKEIFVFYSTVSLGIKCPEKLNEWKKNKVYVFWDEELFNITFDIVRVSNKKWLIDPYSMFPLDPNNEVWSKKNNVIFFTRNTKQCKKILEAVKQNALKSEIEILIDEDLYPRKAVPVVPEKSSRE